MKDLAHWAAERPDAPALITRFGDRTFAELDAAANRMARALRRRGLTAGDGVALVSGNHPVFVETVHACQRAGFRLTPVNWHLTGDEAAYIVTNCEAKALVTTEELAELATGCLAGASACEVGLVTGGTVVDGFESVEDAMAAEDGTPLPDPVPGTTMFYTSGTTGRPKGVHRSTPPATSRGNLFGYREEGGDVHLCTGPLYHAAPLAFSVTQPLAYGATVILMDRWDPEETLQLVEKHQVTHTHMVPTMFHRLLALPDETRRRYDLSSLRHALHGAAPCPVPVKQRMIDWWGPVLWEYYAATEGVGSFVDSATWLDRPGTVGKPYLPEQVIVGDEDGNPLPAGEVGLIYLRAPAEARFSYFKDDEKTASSYRGDYFTLGDVGYMDEEGYIYLTDRSANLIISGGVNIYPAEVDAVLLDHAAVGDVAVIGVPDEEWGEAVLAVVELRNGHDPSPALADELINHCRDGLAHFKCPRQVEFVGSLPREDNGKIYKRRLREAYRELRTTATTSVPSPD